MPIDLTSDVTTVANTATIDVDTAAGDNDGNGVVAAAGGVVQIFGNGNGSQSAVQYDIQSWEIETGARIEVIGFNADIILSPLDKARFDNADFEIVGIDPAWTIQANVPTAPLFWMKGSEPSQFSGSGDSLVISSSSPDLYPDRKSVV